MAKTEKEHGNGVYDGHFLKLHYFVSDISGLKHISINVCTWYLSIYVMYKY